MKPYLILQYPYDHIEIALCHQGKVTIKLQESKLHAVELTIPGIQQILAQEALSITDLSFIAVNTGPGPYNTLRALITTANGIHFVQKTPLVSACALDLLLAEKKEQPSLAILNAFAKHVFYAFDTSSSQEQGYCSIENLIQKINRQEEQFTLLGNGAQLYRDELLRHVHKKVVFPEKMPLFNSLDILAQQAYENFTNKKTVPSFLMPKYLQSPAIKK